MTARFTLNWYEELKPGDVLFYYDDTPERNLHNIRYDGLLVIDEKVHSCIYGLDDRSDGIAPFFGEPEDEVVPWIFCDARNNRLLVWSAPDYHLPNRNPDIPKCKDPDIDSDELQVQTDCQVEWDDWFGYDKELIEVVR